MKKVKSALPAESNETKAISFRLKPEVADRIRDAAHKEGKGVGEFISQLIDSYDKNESSSTNKELFFQITTVNRFLNCFESKLVPFYGKIVFCSPKSVYKSAAPFKATLKRLFKIPDDIDFTDLVVASTVSIAETNVCDELAYAVQETCIIKEKNEADFLVFSQWVKYSDDDFCSPNFFSPFVSTVDLASIATIFADVVDLCEADEFAPDFS